MKSLHTQLFSIFFCDKEHCFKRSQFDHLQNSQELLRQSQFQFLASSNLKALIVAHQVHKTNGVIINSLDQALAYRPYSVAADFLVTHIPNIGIGVATADCLPIIFYDIKNHAVGIAHAGWQGTVNNITYKVIESMQENFGTQVQDMQIFFGPCASVENYEVSADFGEKITYGQLKKQISEKTFIQKNNKHYFNLPLYNQLLLEAIGIQKSALNWDFFECTMSNKNFCSYRRDKNEQRQITIVFLKNS